MEIGALHINTASQNESDELIRLAKNTFIETYRDKIPVDVLKRFTERHFSKQKVISEINDTNTDFHIIHGQYPFIGYAKTILKPLNLIDEEAGMFIEKIYLIKPFQNKGIGKQFIEYLYSYALRKQRSIIWLRVWERNMEARSFYEKLGFIKAGELPFRMETLRFNDWVLFKPLTSPAY
jgi:GNAT superfamily N-acetyltransferase